MSMTYGSPSVLYESIVICALCRLNTTGVIPNSQPVLSTEPINYHTCKIVIDRAYRQSYQLGRQATTIVQFTVIARSKSVILGRLPLYAVPAPSTAQVGILVLAPWIHNKQDVLMPFPTPRISN